MKGKQIKNLRRRLGWTQSKLAEYLGFGEQGRGTVSNMEHDKHGPAPGTLRLLRLAKLLGKNVGRLWDPSRAKDIKNILDREDTDDNTEQTT
jgi:transcriptional regulator with XRE-family HTH domain